MPGLGPPLVVPALDDMRGGNADGVDGGVENVSFSAGDLTTADGDILL